jgi:hypothetical protein
MSDPSSPPPSKDKPPIVYTYDNLTGWKSVRPLHPFRGIYHDIRRRLPYYMSDFQDALTYRTIASSIRMYFVK